MEEKDKMRQDMLYEDIRHGYYHLLPKELYSLLVTSANEYDKRTVRIWSQEKPRYHILMEKMTVRGVAFEDRKGRPGYFIRLNPKHFISFADKYFDKELKKKKEAQKKEEALKSAFSEAVSVEESPVENVGAEEVYINTEMDEKKEEVKKQMETMGIELPEGVRP